jgi:HAD superfamily hydrolase (TIGR01509 family)
VSQFDLIIFDCDGVLVDSERLAVRTEALILCELGWRLSEAEIIARFLGRSAADMCKEVEAHIGRAVDWDEEFEARYREVFEKELVAVTGIVDALDVIDTLTCVASSGTHSGIQYRLEKTGLLSQFSGRIFSSDDVARGKPAPDIFLHAAQSMGVHPRNCAVVEDSVSGVVAGIEAAMTVFGFSGSVTSSEKLASAGATAFSAMSELPNLLISTPLRG